MHQTVADVWPSALNPMARAPSTGDSGGGIDYSGAETPTASLAAKAVPTLVGITLGVRVAWRVRREWSFVFGLRLFGTRWRKVGAHNKIPAALIDRVIVSDLAHTCVRPLHGLSAIGSH
jgi:hypothetical protein